MVSYSSRALLPELAILLGHYTVRLCGMMSHLSSEPCEMSEALSLSELPLELHELVLCGYG
jgi:hypothetical protein